MADSRDDSEGLLRALVVAPSAYPLGGIATWLDYLLPGLAERGWSATLGLVSGRWHDVDRYREVHPYANVLAISNPTGSEEGRARALIAAFAQCQPQLVIGVNQPSAYAAVARLRAQRRPSPKVAMTIHGIEPDLYEDVRLFRDTLDAAICTNRLACRLAEVDGGIEAGRTLYAPYGVIGAAPPKRDPSRELRIAYVGRMDQSQKRVLDLPGILSALDALNIPFRLVLAGGGPELERLAQGLGPWVESGRARFLGVLDEQRLVEEVYRSCDVLLLTSSWETGPIVIWEAMAHGMGIVSTSYVGSGREAGLADGENCLLFPIGDVSAAAKQLACLLDVDLLSRIVRGGHELISERYSRTRSMDAWDRCLRSVLALPRHRGEAEIPRAVGSGRLDRLLGKGRAETLRHWLNKSYAHADPGGEWPHSFGQRRADDPAFWALAQELDRRS